MKKGLLQTLIVGLFAFISISSYAQSRVTGTVKSSDGELLPGASVVIKGTSIGVITDFEGRYNIEVPQSDVVLLFSFVGMDAKEEPLQGRLSVDVILQTSSIGVDEVVVTALGISRASKSLGYSVSEVSGENLENATQENVLNALSGKVPGVTINSTGAAGSSVSMVIRGATSLTSDNQPLFVIDGVPVNNTLNNVSSIGSDNNVDYGNAISDLNSNDIESMSILKGPSAAALYGSRAGNGVVLITTKKGKKAKGLGVSISSSTVLDIPYKYVDTQSLFANGSRPYTPTNYPSNSYGSMVIAEDASGWVGPELNKGYTAIQWPYTPEELESGIPVSKELKSYNNAENFFETGITSTNSVSVANQTDKINYRVSFTNMQNKGYIPNSDLHKNSISSNISLNLTDNFTISSVINYSKNGSDNRPAGNRGANPLQALYNINSHINVLDMKDYWEEGKEGIQQSSPYTWGDYDSREFNNPYFLANEVNNSFNRDRIFGNIDASWQITPDLSVKARYAHDEFKEKRETKIAYSYTEEANGAYGIINLERFERNTDFLVTYKKRLDEVDFSVSAGGNAMYQKGSNNYMTTKSGGSGLITPGIYSLTNISPDNLDYGSSWWEKAIYSVYALASFGYKDMVYLDLTARNDWSSTLPEDNRSFFYPSASLSLLLNNMLALPSDVSLLKLRGGWAQVGNDTDPYKLYPVLGNEGAWGNVTRLSASGELLSPDLKPEIQTSYEFGADLNFYDSRLRLSGTWYHSDNKNQVLSIDLPASSGASSKQINAGLISAKGWEATLGLTPIANSNWKWDLNFSFTRNRTILKELADGMTYIKLWGDAKGGAYTWVGDEIGQIIDRKMVRVEDPDSEYYGYPILDSDGYDQSNSKVYDDDGNRVAPVIGNFNPDLMVGLQTSLSYKRFTLSANFDWRIGGQFVSQTLRYGESDLHSQRWLDRTLKLNNLDDIPAYLKEHADEYLSPDGMFYVVVGGPTADTGGFEHTEGGITLNDGVFMPGVYEDDNGNYVENLGGGDTKYVRYQDFYGWSYTRTATFDADFIKLRDVSITYKIPEKIYSSIGIQNASISVFSRNLILWTKAKINIDPENAFQPESSTQASGIQFKQGIERYNVNPWVIPVGLKLNLNF
ncbi:SusC/RagA family TonB-linked outer membrane protein [Mangrovibacterium diazotrophicum]|uniref:TonB-linked SusC/RagA family outer membrane protein n=1 Tax=Mangrovibacterium diazotrophicum TaxID=1261403 RepID=A0A419W4J4_9BACT|nr:SusC/RagA family TonB-linked outer membrane protein [Mangrovibacterium diazotrophicum]RKD90369.1 TonB-linked SusC/RagA family outer membrane protein [Mangrovibacterium diazotrophicum]